MPSSPQVVPVVVLFDYLLSDTGVGMQGQRVTVVLNSTAPATSVSPPTVIAQVQQSTTTDQNGYWQFSLVPNTNISPANTTYTVLTPAGTYDVTLGAVGPYQSTALGTIVNVPVPLTAPAASSIPSLLVTAGEPGIDTVGAGALLLGDNTATSVEIGSGAVPVTINGQVVAVSSTGVQINAAGDISARSLTLSSSGPYAPSALALAGGFAFTTKKVVAPPPGGGDDTLMLRSLTTGGNVTVELQPGTYILDLANAVTVGSGGNQYITCLALPSNTWLKGSGIGITTIQLLAATRSVNLSGLTQTMLGNLHPDLTTDTSIFVSDLTLDGNRQNQGPQAYAPSSATTTGNVIRGLVYFGGSKMGGDNLEVKNFPDFAIFLEAGATNLAFGRIYSANCVTAIDFDAATNSTLNRVVSVNSDPALAVNTTSTATVSAGSSQNILVGSSAGMVANTTVLLIGAGTNNYEYVLVTAVPDGTHFTAYFANAHGPSSFTVTSASFKSDSAVQANLLAAQITIDSIDVDYTSALAVVGAGLEIAGAQSVAVGVVVARGTYRGAWIHNWNIGATHYIVQAVTVASLTCINTIGNLNGSIAQAIYMDDHALNGGTDTMRNVAIGAAVVYFGKGGASIPNGCWGLGLTPNVQGCTFGVLTIDGPVLGIVLRGQYNSYGSVVIRNTSNQGMNVDNSASNNSFGTLVINNTGLTNAALGAGINFDDNTACNDNVFHGVNLKTIPGASSAIDLSANTTAVNNSFAGDVSGNSALNPVKLAATGIQHVFQLVGYNLVPPLQKPTEAVLVSGVPALNGATVQVTLTAARLVGAPLNPFTGQRLQFVLIQDGTGGRAVTWNAAFKVTWADTGNTLNKRSTIAFVYDGTNWNQDGAQTAYV